MSEKKPKNIVICCDGTGNQFGTANSNVVKIYTCLHVGGEREHHGKLLKEQVAYYHPGVGTMGAPNRTTKLGRAWSQVKGLAFGSGFNDNIADAYRFLMGNYADGDHIFLFGFSRGGYTVRALAGLLNMYGLLCQGNEGHLPYALRSYSEKSKDAFRRNLKQMPQNDDADAFKATFSREVAIHFAGIWDAVSSVGWVYDPVKLLFDAKNPIYRTGRHAVSISERRCYFQNNLWGEPLPGQDIVQAWFSGVHSDVGGGYAQSECAPSIDALKWILAEAEAAGLSTYPEKRNAVFGIPSHPFEDLAKYYVAPPPFTRLNESLTWKWWPLELLPHLYFDAYGRKHLQIEPWPHRREIPYGSLIHPSVKHWLAHNYTPKNLDATALVAYPEAPREQLAKDGIAGRSDLEDYFVYAPKQPQPTASAAPKIATAAALAIAALGAAWSVLRR